MMNHVIPRKMLWLLGVMVLLMVAISTQSVFADDRKDKGDDKLAIACELKKTLRYDYTATFQNDADVESFQGSGHNSVLLNSSATVEITAIQSDKSLCTYAVELTNVELVEMLDAKTVEQVDGKDIPASMYDTFFFTQQSDGQIREIILGGKEQAEIVTFKRGVVNAFNVTLKDEHEYTVTESDNSGVYTAHYAVASNQKSYELTRTKDASDYIQGSDGKAFQVNVGLNQNSNFNISNGNITSVNTSQMVIIDQPEAGDPIISETFWHDTLTVHATIDVQLQSTSKNEGIARSSVALLESGEMVRISVSAETTLTGNYTLDNHDVIRDLLAQLDTATLDAKLLNRLVIAMRGDVNSVSQVADFLAQNKLEGRAAELIVAALIGVGTPDAQAVVQSHYLNNDMDVNVQRNILGIISTLQQPTASFVNAIADMANDKAASNWETATLVLGALINPLSVTDAGLAAAYTTTLENTLVSNKGDAVEMLYIRALGNAGQNSSISVLASYLNTDDAMRRTVAVEAMRKMESAEVELLLQSLFAVEDNSTVILAITTTQMKRGEAQLNDDSQKVMDIILDESWERVFGNNTVNGTMYAYALIEDEPVKVDVAAGLRAELFNNEFDVAKVQILTEKTSSTERRFYAGLILMDNDIASFDETITCGIDEEHTLWDTTISLPSISSPPIPVGPMTLDFTLESSVDIHINYFFLMSWCDISSLDAELGIKPGIALEADGYATLTLAVLRGGIGISGTIVGVDIPIYFTAELHYQDAINLCFKIDVELKVLDMELYAWGQYWLFSWKPNPKPHWTLWSFNLNPDTYNWYSYCTDDDGSEGALLCIPNVAWWDGTSIDAWWDNANCYVAPAPAGSTPFIANNAYYIESDSSCPANMPWDGTGCVFVGFFTPPWIMAQLSNASVPILTFVVDDIDPIDFIPYCPSGTTQIDFMWGSHRSCEVNLPNGYNTNDLSLSNDTLYLDGNGSCIAGDLDSTGCWLGSAPSATNAFYYSPTNAFYYSEP